MFDLLTKCSGRSEVVKNSDIVVGFISGLDVFQCVGKAGRRGYGQNGSLLLRLAAGGEYCRANHGEQSGETGKMLHRSHPERQIK